jgi:hypothetical protein
MMRRLHLALKQAQRSVLVLGTQTAARLIDSSGNHFAHGPLSFPAPDLLLFSTADPFFLAKLLPQHALLEISWWKLRVLSMREK